MKERILIIDDEEIIRFSFGRLMRNAGYDVETSDTLQNAIKKITENDYDLVLSDIVLGGDSGIDVLRAMRERNLMCPLILITGYPNLDTASEAVRLGAFDYLAKPVDKDALLSITKRALQHKERLEAMEGYRLNLEATVRSVRDVIITVDKDLALLLFNRAAQDHFGLSRADLGRPFNPTSGGWSGKYLEALQQVIATKAPVTLHRLECRPQHGPRCLMSLTASPLLDRSGEISGVVMVAREETSLVELTPGPEERTQFHHIVGRCAEMQRIYALIENLADVPSSVLITGESGTGKELVAEAIHLAGKHGDKPFIKVNCSALPENLLESELFGHVKGAFTGAVKSKIGRFQLAHGGTIFLDEIGDISPRIQQLLLRVLQEREFERVGDSHPVKVALRVIAATNKNLPARVDHGVFREDLYYRLKVVEIALPPLRERREDIPLLVDHFIRMFNEKFGKHIEAASEDVLKIFMLDPWPGNVRQLAHTLEHAFVLCDRNVVTADDLPLDLRRPYDSRAVFDLREHRGCEPQAILRALRKSSWNKAGAARLLGISRQTLYRKMLEHEIAPESQDDSCNMLHD